MLSVKNSSLRLLRIENREADISEKQTIYVGVHKMYVEHEELDTFRQLAASFNDSSLLYRVEMVPYSTNATEGDSLYMDLLKGEGPDILELETLMLPVKDLASKGVFEDLNSYLESSEFLDREDILPCILEVGSYGNELVNLIPIFRIDALMVRQGYTRQGGWTPEEFFAYCEEHSEVPLYHRKTDPARLLLDLIGADSSSYIDWQKKECYFDTEKFIRLLEAVKKVNLSGTGSDGNRGTEFLSGGFLAGIYSLSSAGDSYALVADSLGDYGELAGWPVGTGEPHYRMYPFFSLAINSKSQCKEGAWAFLEYVMTIDFMDWEGTSLGGFSSNRDRFEASLAPSDLCDYVIDDKHGLHWYNDFMEEQMDNVPFPRLTEEGKEAVRFMAAHMYYADTISSNAKYLTIINEEVQSYFSGDKSAEEVAGLIQNRVWLYLQE